MLSLRNDSCRYPDGPTNWASLDTVGFTIVSRSVNGYDQPSSLLDKCGQEGSRVPRAVANLQNCVATPTGRGDYIQCRLTTCDYRVMQQ